MSNQYTLKVYPAGMGLQAYRVMEVCGEDSLDHLCAYIMESFDFTMEHMYEFCMDNRMYSDHSYQSAPEGDEPSTAVKLDKLGLTKGQKFSLHYDFGDDWMFTISVTKIAEVESYRKARVTKKKGEVEQYPDFDEFDEDEEEEEEE